MALNRKQKTFVYVVAGILIVLIAGITIINIILGNIIETQIKNSLNKHDTTNYHVELRKVNANILTGNINLKDLRISPDSSFVGRIKQGGIEQSMAIELTVPTFRLAGINLYKVVASQDIIINKILFKNANFKLYVGNKSKKETRVGDDKKINIDSIYMKGLNGIEIGKIEFTKCKFEIYDLVKEQVVIKNKDLRFEVKDFYLNELEGNNDYFSLNLDNVKIELLKQKFNVPGGNYYINLDRFYFDLSESVVELEKFELKPTYTDKYKLAEKLKFTSEIFDVTIEKIKVSSFDLKKVVEDGIFLIDSINIEGLDLNIFKDKRLPFDEDKRPKMLQQALKNMRLPLYVGKINLKDSYMIYQERTESSSELLTAILADLNVQVHFVSSIKDSINTGKPMLINLQSKFMGKTPLTVNFALPINSSVDTFYFSGHLASAKMKEFNRASLPAIGVKFNSGQLNELSFSGSGNSRSSKGEMTMLYTDLDAEVVKKNQKDKSKFLSWAANTVVHTSNPGKNNKLRVAIMEAERVIYKGFVNLIWRSIQGGIVNTVTPTGKTKKVSKEKKKEESAVAKDTGKKESRKEMRKKKKGNK